MPGEEMMFDIAIIGGGPAGLTAAIYSSRSRLKTVVFEKISPGGQIALTESIENYPGVEMMSGYDLAAIMEKQARQFGAEIRIEEATSLARSADGTFDIQCSETRCRAKAVIAAAGASSRRLGVPGEKEFLSKGVSYCAVCDGAFFRNKTVAVVGGGNTAVEEAIYLTKFASKVYVIHRRDALRAVKIVEERAMANPKIEFVWNSVVEEIKGDNKVTGAVLRNKKSNESSLLPLDGVFVYIGMEPSSRLFQPLVDLDNNGFILADKNMQTKTPGLFAAGDIRDKTIWQVSVAVGDGTVAALMAERYISEHFSDHK